MTPVEVDPLEVLSRGTVDVVVRAELEQKMLAFARGERGPLRVKTGFDPTRPDLHFGHVVLLQKMRQFQDLGHTVVFLVGDYTAMVGDPTGQNDMRPRLSREEVLAAAETYQAQAFKVLDRERTEVRWNGEWLGKLTTLDFIELAAKVTVARIMERDDFQKRWAEHRPIHQHELLYPLLQGYDSVALDADLELGGTDQLFNLNIGRDLMPRYGKPAQSVLTVPLLEGTDARVEGGKVVGKKMSKSADNYVGITEPPLVMFRKCMQIDDGVIWRYFELLSRRSTGEIQALRAATTDPREPKRLFAREMVARFHDDAAAAEADAEFARVYLGEGAPADVPEITAPADGDTLWVPKALLAARLVASTSDGRRQITDGWVEVDGARVVDPKLALPKGTYLLRVGSKNRKFARVTVA